MEIGGSRGQMGKGCGRCSWSPARGRATYRSAWARLQGSNVKFCLYRPPVSPWRALHFKIRWVQEKLTGKKDIPENPSWALYELSKDSARKVELPAVSDWPRRVPGM